MIQDGGAAHVRVAGALANDSPCGSAWYSPNSVSDQYELVPYTEDLTPAVKAFNQRLLRGGIDKKLMYPEMSVPRFPPNEGARVFQQYFLLADARREVRGGFILTQEQWSFRGEPAWVAHLRLPISEGAVDRNFKAVGPQVFHSAITTQPNLYTVGMGGFETAVTKRLKSLGWSMRAVPFYFKLLRPGVFLKTSPYLQKSSLLGRTAKLVAGTGLGSLGVGAFRVLSTLYAPRMVNVSVEEVAAFGDWTDEIWECSHRSFHLIAPRDSRTLTLRYPAEERQFLKLKFSRQGKAIGWALVLDTKMRGNNYFGDARVGTIVDCLADPSDASKIICGATSYLCDRGVDLVVSNHTHRNWRDGFCRAGFLRGPSNYVFALSPEIAKRVEPFDANFGGFFVSRGDGAGPERLME